MFTRLIPPEVLAILLLAVLIGGFVLVVRAVRRRGDFAPADTDAPADLPDLITQQRVSGTVRRVFRDNAQGAWLVEVQFGKRRLAFCPTDFAANGARYREAAGKEIDVALYALSTLAPGGVEAMRDQIKDIDRVTVTPDMVRLVPAGEFANDYAVIGRALSHREDSASGIPVRVYRTEVVRSNDAQMVLELAVPNVPGTAPFPDRSMVHGSARLYGYLAA